MLKQIGLPVVALLAASLFASPASAQAGVRFGVYLGAPAPVYNYAPPIYADRGYYTAPPVYEYAPAYAYPNREWGWHDRDRREYRERDRRDFREHNNYRRDRR